MKREIGRTSLVSPTPFLQTLVKQNNPSLPPLPPLPTTSTNVSEVRFYLWTRQNPEHEQELFFRNEESVTGSLFNPEVKTKVLVHGFTSSGKTTWVRRVTAAYLKMGE